MSSTITPSTSPLCYFYTSPISRFAFTFKIRASSSSPTTMAAASAAKVVPAVIVGGGRVGRALQEMGNRDDVLVRRAEPVPLDFAGPILVCTRNDDLEAVLQSTPQSRWSCTISSHLIDYT